jgi:hypothetical protein
MEGAANDGFDLAFLAQPDPVLEVVSTTGPSVELSSQADNDDGAPPSTASRPLT